MPIRSDRSAVVSRKFMQVLSGLTRWWDHKWFQFRVKGWMLEEAYSSSTYARCTGRERHKSYVSNGWWVVDGRFNGLQVIQTGSSSQKCGVKSQQREHPR